MYWNIAGFCMPGFLLCKGFAQQTSLKIRDSVYLRVRGKICLLIGIIQSTLPSLEIFQGSKVFLSLLGEDLLTFQSKDKGCLSSSFWGFSPVTHLASYTGNIWLSLCCLTGIGLGRLTQNIALVAFCFFAMSNKWSFSLTHGSSVFCWYMHYKTVAG